jgi:polysaccharide export outer membrane protein
MPQSAAGSVIALVLVAVGGVALQGQSAPGAAPKPATVESDRSDWTMWSSGRYRITPGDVIQLTFPYVPEFDQTVAVQPDGYVALRGIRDVYARGRTVAEFKQELLEAYASVLREPMVSVVLKEFEKPYFVASGEVVRPGKYELRGATTVTQALAVAGGWSTRTANKSQVILFRRFSDELLETKQIDVKKMLNTHDLSEDPVLRPGDTLYVPQNRLSKIAPFIPTISLGIYPDPLGFHWGIPR